MVAIVKNLTRVNKTTRNYRGINGIVIHWVGAVSSAKENSLYFKSAYRGASAHYFVDEDSIYQVVEERDVAWHCGAQKYYHPFLRNTNTIGIEMCLYKEGFISNQTIDNTAELVKSLMKKYNIPAENVVRHYDISHKLCPGPYINEKSWEKLHRILTEEIVEEVKEEVEENPYQEPKETVKYNAATKSIALESVKWVQWELKEEGYNLQVDGKFGPITHNVVIDFQRKNHLEVDGKVGPATRRKLKET